MSRNVRGLVGTVAVVFAIFFSAAAAGQYWFVRNKLHEARKTELWGWAEEVRDVVGYRQNWDLTGYRRTTQISDIVLLQTSKGTLIDAEEFVPGTVSNVSLPFTFEYEHPFRVRSDVREEWLLDVHRLKDGMVILGVRTDMLPENAEKRIQMSAMRFGDTLADAMSIRERSIDEAFDWTVVDSGGIIRSAIGGIPVKSNPPQISGRPEFVAVDDLDGNLYAMLKDPIRDNTGQIVGLITVLKEVTGEEQALHESAVFNIIVAALSWIVSVLVLVSSLRRLHIHEITCSQVPLLEESNSIEFKSSLRWDYVKQNRSQEVEKAVIKAVAGFLNSENGGTLVIGLDDKGQVLGLAPDYATFSVRADRDGFEQRLRQLLINAVGAQLCTTCVKVRFCMLSGKEVCLVAVGPAPRPVYLDEAGGPTMYVRVGNSTRPFNSKEAVEYAAGRWSPAVRDRLFRPRHLSPDVA